MRMCALDELLAHGEQVVQGRGVEEAGRAAVDDLGAVALALLGCEIQGRGLVF